MQAEEAKSKSNRRRNVPIIVLAMILLFVVASLSVFHFGLITPRCSGFNCGPIVSITATTCTVGSPSICTVSFQNTGSAVAATVQCSLQTGNSIVVGVNGGQASVEIPAPGNVAGTCSTLSSMQPGNGVQGEFLLSNGEEILFASTWALG